MSAAGPGAGPKARLLTPRFLVVVASGACYFSALGTLNPVVPRSLGRGEVEVGIAMGGITFGLVAFSRHRGAYTVVALVSVGSLLLLRGSFGRQRIAEGDAAAAALDAQAHADRLEVARLEVDYLEPEERLRVEEPGVLP